MPSTAIADRGALRPRGRGIPVRAVLRRLPELLVIWVPLLLCAGQVVVFTAWTTWISFTPSTLMPESGWVGWRNYTSVLASRNWKIAFDNMKQTLCSPAVTARIM